MTNKRWATRKELDLSGYLQPPGQPAVAFRTRDLSLRGAFVYTSPFHASCGDLVSLLFSAPWDHDIMLPISATIVRRSEHGIGLRYCQFTPTFFTAMRSLLFSSTPQVAQTLPAANCAQPATSAA